MGRGTAPSADPYLMWGTLPPSGEGTPAPQSSYPPYNLGASGASIIAPSALDQAPKSIVYLS